MNYLNIRKRILGNGIDVESSEDNPSKKQRRSRPAHGLRQLSQREQLKNLLGKEEDSLELQTQSNHPTAKNHTVSFSFEAMQCDKNIIS